jgi:hypothetical protein
LACSKDFVFAEAFDVDLAVVAELNVVEKDLCVEVYYLDCILADEELRAFLQQLCCLVC